MNYLNFLTQKGIIEEARQRGFGYTLDAKTDKLEVLAKSEGANKKIDDLVKEYKGIADLYKEVEEEKKTLQAKVKAKIKEVIDEDDQIKAIVLRSANTSYELAKSSIGKDKTDYEKIFVAMQALLSGELLDKLNDLKKIYTEAGKMTEFESKRETKVTVTEGIVETFIRKIKSVASKLSKFVSKFQTKLDSIAAKVADLKSKKS